MVHLRRNGGADPTQPCAGRVCRGGKLKGSPGGTKLPFSHRIRRGDRLSKRGTEAESRRPRRGGAPGGRTLQAPNRSKDSLLPSRRAAPASPPAALRHDRCLVLREGGHGDGGLRGGSRRSGTAPPHTQHVTAPAASYRSHGRGFGSPCSAAAESRPGSAVTGSSQAMPSGAESRARKTRKRQKIIQKKKKKREEKPQAWGGSRGAERARSAAGSSKPLCAPLAFLLKAATSFRRSRVSRSGDKRENGSGTERTRRRVLEIPPLPATARPRQRGQDPELRGGLFAGARRL